MRHHDLPPPGQDDDLNTLTMDEVDRREGKVAG